jgi:hypothetical protein
MDIVKRGAVIVLEHLARTEARADGRAYRSVVVSSCQFLEKPSGHGVGRGGVRTKVGQHCRMSGEGRGRVCVGVSPPSEALRGATH